MRIDEVSKKTGMKKRTIYFYIKEELLAPPVNSENGYYDFQEEDVRRLLLIGEFRNAGFPISMIRSIIKEPATAPYYLSNYVSALKSSGRISKRLSRASAMSLKSFRCRSASIPCTRP
ncbi:MerR family transcriptional regulator [Lachnospiraceae bacterium 47-T17]